MFLVASKRVTYLTCLTGLDFITLRVFGDKCVLRSSLCRFLQCALTLCFLGRKLSSVPYFTTPLITTYRTAKATGSSETSVHFYETIRCYTPSIWVLHLMMWETTFHTWTEIKVKFEMSSIKFNHVGVQYISESSLFGISMSPTCFGPIGFHIHHICWGFAINVDVKW